MGSAEGLQRAGHLAFHGVGTHRLALAPAGSRRGESGNSSPRHGAGVDVNEIKKSGTTSSAACLCTQIPATGCRAWFAVPVERLAWRGEERAISVSDSTLCCRHLT